MDIILGPFLGGNDCKLQVPGPKKERRCLLSTDEPTGTSNARKDFRDAKAGKGHLAFPTNFQQTCTGTNRKLHIPSMAQPK